MGLADREAAGVQVGPDGVVTEENISTHCCLVAIGRLQVTSTPNSSDLAGSNSNNGKYYMLLLSTYILYNSSDKTNSTINYTPV